MHGCDVGTGLQYVLWLESMVRFVQHRVQGELNGVRDVAGRFCMRTLEHHNSPFIMASCGSKGSSINIAQMVALVGQQSVSGKRCQDGFVGRTTPHFPRYAGALSACSLLWDVAHIMIIQRVSSGWSRWRIWAWRITCVSRLRSSAHNTDSLRLA